jgi:4-diphosphocytidyl-2-C-methyl-D-erythritol kinase
MVSFPHAKINLGLNVIRKRNDGYHELETCFFPIGWTDILEIIPSNSFQFSSTGLVIEGNSENNLCVKAYQLLRQEFDLPPVHIHLHKVVPMGAGLGGGSSDAAFTLRQLNDKFDLGLSQQKLEEYAARLGSDCAFFISDLPRLGNGRGEVLSPVSVSLKGKFLVVVKPDVHVSTAEAFAGIRPGTTSVSIKDVIEGKPIHEWKHFLKNNFEEFVFQKHASIAKIKQELYNQGATYASMSGSGSSVFGIFEKKIELADIFKGMAYWSSLITSPSVPLLKGEG